ncbi:MAG: type II secretion system minor pseudopilin GspH [Gammaproteobacteria bacterium]
MQMKLSQQQPARSRLFAFLPARQQAGFTLLELMVVVVIIGIIMSFATLSIGGGDRRADELKQEAQRFMALLELASSEAILRSEQMAIRIGDEEYEYFLLRDRKWLALQDDEQLRLRTLPTGIKLKLEMEDSPLSILQDDDASDEEGEEDEEPQDPPQVFLLSSGEVTPFQLTFAARETERKYTIDVSLMGEMELTSDKDDD